MDKIIYLWDMGLKLPFINPKLQLAIPKTEPIYENSGAIGFNGTHLVIGGVNQVGVLSLKNIKVRVVKLITSQTGFRGSKLKKKHRYFDLIGRTSWDRLIFVRSICCVKKQVGIEHLTVKQENI